MRNENPRVDLAVEVAGVSAEVTWSASFPRWMLVSFSVALKMFR
jgi:hypothetical protein